jgi:hypothetical protein
VPNSQLRSLMRIKLWRKQSERLGQGPLMQIKIERP